MKNKIELVQITADVLNTYRKFVKNNTYETEEMARKKLTRNILCGKYLYNNNNIKVYGYGCLRICINSNNTVVRVMNYRKPIDINRELKDKLDKSLGIVKMRFIDRLKNLLKIA